MCDATTIAGVSDCPVRLPDVLRGVDVGRAVLWSVRLRLQREDGGSGILLGSCRWDQWPSPCFQTINHTRQLLIAPRTKPWPYRWHQIKARKKDRALMWCARFFQDMRAKRAAKPRSDHELGYLELRLGWVLVCTKQEHGIIQQARRNMKILTGFNPTSDIYIIC